MLTGVSQARARRLRSRAQLETSLRTSDPGERELSRRVGQVVGYLPLVEMSDDQRREFHEALLDADSFEDLPGKWQAAILEAEQNRPELRVVSGD